MKKLKTIALCAAVFTCLSVFTVTGKKEVFADKPKVNHTLRAETVTIVDETTDLNVTLGEGTTETYNPSDRRWCGVSSVIVAGKNIFAAWQTGGDKEPSPYNYITVAASTDGGKSWIEPFMIIDPPEEVMITVPMFYYNDLGQLFLLFFHRNVGVHAIPLHNMDGDLSEAYYDKPFFIGVKNSSFTKPTIFSDGSIGFVSGSGDASTNNAAFYRSTDHGNSFSRVSVLNSSVTSLDAKRYAESTVVELSDGRYWALRRLENAANGGMEQYFSSDKGATWTKGEADLPKPLFTPGSRFDLKRLKSGALILITNAEGMGSTNRRKMTAYLSTDDGKTWGYSLLLDNYITSYPDFYQTDDGTIYILFDKNRYGEGGIRLCVLTEEDIKAGEFCSENAKQLIVITKIRKEYTDIVSVNGAFDRKISVPLGTEAKDVIKNLPAEIAVTDEYGAVHVLSGTYTVSGYDKTKTGIYNGTFRTTLPQKENLMLQDSFGLLNFKVEVKEKSSASGGGKGCKSGITSSSASLFAAALAASFFVLVKSKVKNEKK